MKRQSQVKKVIVARNKRTGYANRQNRSVDGNGSRPPHVLGSQQIQTQLRVKDRTEIRAVAGVVEITSSATGNVVVNVATNQVEYAVAQGTGTSRATADTAWSSSFELFRIKKVEVVWNPIVPTSTAVPSLYAAYDEIIAGTGFLTNNLTTLINYNNHIRFDPRMGTSFTYVNKAPSATAGFANVIEGGWQITSQMGTFAGGGSNNPGVITIQGTGMGTSILLGRLEINYLVAVKGRN